MADRYDSLNPRDIVISLRTFPRRYRAVTGPVASNPELAALDGVPDVDGISLLERVGDVARTLALLTLEIHRTVIEDEPVLNPGAQPGALRDWTEGPDLGLSAAAELLAGEATDMADELDGLASNDWNRTAKIAGSGAVVTVTDLAREAVRVSAEQLYKAEAQLAQLRAVANQ